MLKLIEPYLVSDGEISSRKKLELAPIANYVQDSEEITVRSKVYAI